MATVLNLQQIRADRSAKAPVIVGPDGKSYQVGGVPLDTYLEIIELQQVFDESTGDTAGIANVFRQFKALIERTLPGFPTGDLTIEEIMLVIDAMQTEVGPQVDGEVEATEKAGEPMPPT